MPLFDNLPPSQRFDSALRLPAQRRISLPASQRLTTITEGPSPADNPGRAGRDNHRLAPSTSRPGSSPWRRSGPASVRPSQDTARTAPPTYDWVPEPVNGEEDFTAPVEGEKVAELRRESRAPGRRRGGWGRLVLIAAILVAIAIGLGVGLGVGLAKRKGSGSGNESTISQPAGTNSGQIQQFPLGEYSLVTALRAQNTNCTSNPATWNCYPYATFNESDSSTNTSSLATFNWILTNTSSLYATNTTPSTPTDGIDANLTISSTNNPFSISFANQSVKYISSSSNTSAVRYTFSFLMPKAVIPSASLTSNNAAAECFFNETLFTGTLYLNAPSTFPSAALGNSTGLGGYTLWPSAVEITQSQAGGQDVPACYETIDGAVGPRILTGLTPQPVDSQCACEYRNF